MLTLSFYKFSKNAFYASQQWKTVAFYLISAIDNHIWLLKQFFGFDYLTASIQSVYTTKNRFSFSKMVGQEHSIALLRNVPPKKRSVFIPKEIARQLPIAINIECLQMSHILLNFYLHFSGKYVTIFLRSETYFYFYINVTDRLNY